MSTIAVVDYGMGNLRSVAKALEHVAQNQQVIVTSSAEEIHNADRVVFPGQGAARDCMLELADRQLTDVVLNAAHEKPFLGICMGMQVLLSHSQENNGVDCMGLYPGEVRYFGDNLQDEQGEKLKIPHMGWNRVHHRSSHALWQGIDENSRFYFVHSYYMDPADKGIILATTDYGFEFVSGIGRDNVFAVQFHPEKSAQDGLQLLKNFAEWDGKQ
ncbi:MAG: imidazole glycerol phosphate synthase subunit HisH [Gammaproteobacteria bacterium]|nr:imidazole glycerol phosphate synthase subunit HisH [Gammaproteobacteria bacterium]